MKVTQIVVVVLLILCAALHAFLVYGEMIPGTDGLPKILAGVLDDRGINLQEPEPKGLVVTIVQNAGAYNAIMALGFVVALLLPRLRFLDLGRHGAAIFQGFFCVAAIWVGIFGISLSSKTILQAIFGGATLLAIIISCRANDKPAAIS